MSNNVPIHNGCSHSRDGQYGQKCYHNMFFILIDVDNYYLIIILNTYMYVYMYVCMYICMYECMYVCMYVYIYIYICVCVCVCVCVYVYCLFYVCICMYDFIIIFFNVRAQFLAESRCVHNVTLADLWIICLQCGNNLNWKAKVVQRRHVASAI